MDLQHFFAQSDGVGKTLFGLLLAMSMASWFFILVKAWQGRINQRRSQRFLAHFWAAASLDDVAKHLSQTRAFSQPCTLA